MYEITNAIVLRAGYGVLPGIYHVVRIKNRERDQVLTIRRNDGHTEVISSRHSSIA